ncbi:MAG: hypothetical protein QW279_02730 [Candidatus Jordarchaeaceae archaeon]
MSSNLRKSYYKEIMRKLNVKAPDEKIYIVAERILLEYISCTDNEERKEITKELQRIEGILWERHRQLKFWISALIKKKASEDEIKDYIERKKKCLSAINQIRGLLGKKPYGYNM